MNSYVVALGYRNELGTVDEYQTIAVFEADTAEQAAIDCFNGLEPADEENAVFQVRKAGETEYNYFNF